ncbi:maleylpyruvate isomerase N-terminal domain-containing protein [Nocardia gamkensis]|uniref:maleylpyruvate isomerase N-terminal domain-containing protein n=1 Tax=Nocardia gamkensis TaxID=352869 RepID=UPI0037C9FE5D
MLSERAAMRWDRAGALQRERAEMVRFCRELDESEWRTASRATGWRVQDVMAHLSSGCRSMFSPGLLRIMRSKDIERTNDWFVDQRRSWGPLQTFREYERWSAGVVTLAKALNHLPADRVHLPLAELGWFPAGLLVGGAMVFDHHTHLRHDIAPALSRPVPKTDAGRMATVLEWMFAVLGNQLRSDEPDWLTQTIVIELEGPGGGSRSVSPGAAIAPGEVRGAAATISGLATDFPEWATRRACWRDRDVRISGDAEYAARFLDWMNVI